MMPKLSIEAITYFSQDALYHGGPLGAILGYAVVGSAVYCLCVSIGEMIAFLSVNSFHTSSYFLISYFQAQCGRSRWPCRPLCRSSVGIFVRLGRLGQWPQTRFATPYSYIHSITGPLPCVRISCASLTNISLLACSCRIDSSGQRAPRMAMEHAHEALWVCNQFLTSRFTLILIK